MQTRYMGWLPDFPDNRDFTPEDDEAGVRLNSPSGKSPEDVSQDELPPQIDLRQWDSPIEDQGEIGSCTAQAAVGLLEFCEQQARGTFINASRLFVYKVTRNLLGWTGDTGAFCRSALQALVVFGAPPEDYWPYNTDKFDQEPTPFLYNYAQAFQGLKYQRLDPPNTGPEQQLRRIKAHLASKTPAMFGFPVYESLYRANQGAASEGHIPFPANNEKQKGGHAVVAIGFDDQREVRNPINGKSEKGALMIRNSWGTSWGNRGYGWMPYRYVLEGLARDWWVLTKAEWLQTGQFEPPKGSGDQSLHEFMKRKGNG